MGNIQENINFSYETELAKCKTIEDITGKDGLVQRMIKNALEQMLSKEMDNFLDREKHERNPNQAEKNYRNGSYPKKVKTAFGDVNIHVPRDRKGEFIPEAIQKFQETEPGLETKIVSMYSKGMSTRDIRDHIQGLYGTDISASRIK